MELLRLLDRRRRVVGQEGRDLHRDEAVLAVRLLVDGPEQVGGALQVLEREREEDLLGLDALLGELGDLLVV